MKLDKSTLEKRKPLWLALSYIAQSMKESSYSYDEITQILMTEVLPICISNMHSVAGIWEGFDEKWLTQKIIDLKPSSLLQRWFHKRTFWMIEEDWRAVVYKFNSDDSFRTPES